MLDDEDASRIDDDRRLGRGGWRGGGLLAAAARWDGPSHSAANAPVDASTLQHAARVEVDATEYDFGSLSLGAKGQRRFVFRNVGHSPLRLTAGAILAEMRGQRG